MPRFVLPGLHFHFNGQDREPYGMQQRLDLQGRQHAD